MGWRHFTPRAWLLAAGMAVGLGGCATRAVEVAPLSTDPAEFLAWDCTRIDDELDSVQQRAADLAYSVDQRAGNNIMALGVGVAVFWPVLLAMRPDGLEATDLARLKGRFEALQTAARQKACPPAADELPAARAAALPLSVGDTLVYEERDGSTRPATLLRLKVMALRRGEIEYQRLDAAGGAGPWRNDRVGNVVQAPDGALIWPQLLRGNLDLGSITAGDMVVAGSTLGRARLRAQVVAVGPQQVGDRRFHVAVLELFGDAQRGEAFTRVEGSMAVERSSGVLLRLDLRSAQDTFSLQRRLVRIDPPSPPSPPSQ